MSITDVIERSRQPGTFSERARFTVARSRAIEKMRQFALADPAYYILEWIQAAIANGATYLDIEVEAATVRMSYVGGGFARSELTSLFDFLFANKDDLDVADVRQLALGVNALLASNPVRIVIESGDGTLEGTTRVELIPRQDSVTIGTPTAPLEGTFIRAEGLSRGLGQLSELNVIESRCLTAPIPILVNGDSLFGYTSERSPDLFGYPSQLKFDEGDLYGTIGLARTPIMQTVKLLTWGVWISSTRAPFEGLPPIGGVIGYDRLRKTADHANVVHDEVYRQMWARVEMYARQLVSGKTGMPELELVELDGKPLNAMEFRERTMDVQRAVLFEAYGAALKDDDAALAREFGQTLDAPVFVVGPGDRETVVDLAGADVEILTPRLSTSELEFFQSPAAKAPARPWLSPEEDLGALALDTKRAPDHLARALEGSTRIEAKAYTPKRTHAEPLTVELRHLNRRLATTKLESHLPGLHIAIDVDGPVQRENIVAGIDAIGYAVLRQCREQLESISLRALDPLRPDDVSAGDASAAMALAAAARGSFVRFRSDGDTVSPMLALWDERVSWVVMKMPVLRTARARNVTLNDFRHLMIASFGLLYAARHPSDVPPEVDPGLVLLVDDVTEPILRELIGEAACVRVDDLQPVVEQPKVASIAVTDGTPSTRPFLGVADATIDASTQERIVRALMQSATSIDEPHVRRGAIRNLIWHLCHLKCRENDGDDMPAWTPTLRQLPLFRLSNGANASWDDLETGLFASNTSVLMVDGWPLDTLAEEREVDPEGTPGDVPLACNPYVLQTLSSCMPVAPALDVDLSLAEARAADRETSSAFIESRQLDDARFEGQFGFPILDPGRGGILVTHRPSRRAEWLSGVTQEVAGLAGHLRANTDDFDRRDVEGRCIEVATTILANLVNRVPAMDTTSIEFDRALQLLLSFAERHIQITASTNGVLSFSTFDRVTPMILDLPLFPTVDGVSATAGHLLRDFVAFGGRRDHPKRTRLAPDLSPALSDWLDRVLRVEAAVPEPVVDAVEYTTLAEWLSDMLNRLRPDEDTWEFRVRILPHKEILRLLPGGVRESHIHITSHVLILDDDFWLLESAVDAAGKIVPEQAAWLLLAVYAYANEARFGITNFDEIEFQGRVFDWLDAQQRDA